MSIARTKVTFVIDHFIPWRAGTEHQLTMIIENLPVEWNVEIVVFRASDWLKEHADSLRVRAKVIQIDNFRSYSTYRNIVSLVAHLRQSKPDVVHTFFPVANIVGVIAARLAGVPLIISSRRDFGEWMTPRYLAATRFANRFVSKIITNSSRVRTMTHTVEGVELDDIQVIANGIDVQRFSELPDSKTCRAKLGVADDDLVVGLVANYRPMKRHKTLVRAAARVVSLYPHAKFVLVGTNATDEDLLSEVRSLTHQLGVEEQVIFTHSSEDIRDLLATFDVCVNCSEGEGLSNAIMEYMASGLPCVVTDSGGNPDLIVNNETGYLFELDNDEELASLLSALFASKSERKRLGENARSAIVENYSVQAMVDRFIAAYTATD